MRGCVRDQCRVVEVNRFSLRSLLGMPRPMRVSATTKNMKNSLFPSPFTSLTRLTSLRSAPRPRACPKCRKLSPFQQRYAHNPADDHYFESIVDNPPVLVRSGQKHGPGLIVLSRSPGRFSAWYVI